MPEFLPKKYEFIHDYCFYIHDLLAGIIKEGERSNIFNITLNFKVDEHKKSIEGKNGEELITWMRNKGYQNEIFSLYLRQIYVALLSDYCHFIYEALDCSIKAKLTVSYALMRKPFKDNLFYLEWLLANPNKVLALFDNENGVLEIRVDKFKPEEKVQIITEAMNKTWLKQWIDPKIIYALRYRKDMYYGFEPLWQKANHLITTNKYYTTEDANFNLVFSNNFSKVTQWDHIYSILPILLFYSYNIIETLVKTFAKRKNEFDYLIDYKVLIGLCASLSISPWKEELEILPKLLSDLMNLDMPCVKCGNNIKLKDIDFIISFKKNFVKCDKCKERIYFHC